MKKEIKLPSLQTPVGWYFLTRKNGRMHYQGIVKAHVHGSHYIVQLFSWIMGEPTDALILDLSKSNHSFDTDTETCGVLFFESLEDMEHRISKENQRQKSK